MVVGETLLVDGASLAWLENNDAVRRATLSVALQVASSLSAAHGFNRSSSLGDTMSRAEPTLVPGLEGVVEIAAALGRRADEKLGDGDQQPWSKGLSCPMVKRACALCAGAAGRPGPRYHISDGAPRLVAPTRGRGG